MRRIVVFDFDGTLTRQRGGFKLLHTLYGTAEAGEELMARYESGEVTFEEWCRMTADTWRNAGVTATDIDRATRAVKPKEGATEVLKSLERESIPFGILSAGVGNLTYRFEQYDPEFIRGNFLRFSDGQLSDIDVDVGPSRKGELLREFRDELSETEIRYVGDSHTDTEAFEEADTAVLFDPDERVPDAAIAAADTIVESDDLRDTSEFLLGN
ncbi:HAD family hydrolase [Haloarcula nitratireducens]|uniref:phosphoserine phosphatase n=1 Tax=Haloarcula nitratireducens TaxID=2487749 RepID=A0AAW4PI56_9EURY|nr:HAD-IB family phosphatase [Halomicroarcula nitratireducens]MBX0297509.1 HAD-IB family phosphatase [Halomicroarcula nitratireducens]